MQAGRSPFDGPLEYGGIDCKSLVHDLFNMRDVRVHFYMPHNNADPFLKKWSRRPCLDP